MRQSDLIKLLEDKGFFLKRVSKHLIYFNPLTKKTIPISRTRTVPHNVAQAILHQMEVKL